MTDREPTRITTRRAATILVGGLLVVVGAVGADASLGDPSLSSVALAAASSLPKALSSPARSASISASPTGVPPSGQRAAPGELGGVLSAGATIPRDEHVGTLGTSDGVVRDGVTVFDSGYPAVSRLDPALLRALRTAPTTPPATA